MITIKETGDLLEVSIVGQLALAPSYVFEGMRAIVAGARSRSPICRGAPASPRYSAASVS
jgi:hypothetical protein